MDIFTTCNTETVHCSKSTIPLKNKFASLVAPLAASDSLSLSSASVKVIFPEGDTNAPGKAAFVTEGGKRFAV